MAQTWHREEPREVRPFFKLAKAEEALVESRIRLFADSESSPESTHLLDDIDFRRLAPVIEPVLVDPKLWMPKDLTSHDLKLVLLAEHGFLKRSQILHAIPLSQDLPSHWEIDRKVVDRLGGGKGLVFTLAVCLAIDRKPLPGSPFVLGHWLARKSFSLLPQTMRALFDVQPRTDEQWIAANFPPKTLFSVDYTDGIASAIETGGSVATVFVHADAYNKMANSKLGDSLQPILAAEIIVTILAESYEEWKDLDDVDSGSPLETILRQLGKGKAMNLEDLKSLTKNKALLRARLQDHLSVVQSL